MTATTPQGDLSPIQRQRAAALREARAVLSNTTIFSTSAPADPVMLITLARFILVGRSDVDELVDALLEERTS